MGEHITKKVLVADDEEGTLSLVLATLGNDPRYCLLLARDGEEALRVAREERPALVFLDIRMPKRDGYQVCRALKEDPATSYVKVVMLTALAQESDRRKAMEAGAEDYFTKPFRPTALLEKVEEMLGPG